MTAERDDFRPTALKSTLVAVAWLEAKSAAGGHRLPPRKLQMLLYIAQALYGAANGGRPLMPSMFIASRLGPIDPNLYDILESTGSLPPVPADIEPRAEACLGLVWRRYGQSSLDELDAFVGDDGVFLRVRDTAPGAVIPLEMLSDTYRRNMIDPAVAVRTGGLPEAPPPPPDSTPATLADGRTVRKWAPKRRVY